MDALLEKTEENDDQYTILSLVNFLLDCLEWLEHLVTRRQMTMTMIMIILKTNDDGGNDNNERLISASR